MCDFEQAILQVAQSLLKAGAGQRHPRREASLRGVQ